MWLAGAEANMAVGFGSMLFLQREGTTVLSTLQPVANRGRQRFWIRHAGSIDSFVPTRFGLLGMRHNQDSLVSHPPLPRNP